MLGGLPVIYGIKPYLEEVTPSHLLGTVGYDTDGRKFRYAKFGTTLTAGELLQTSVEDTGDQSLLVATTAIGATQVTTTDTVTVAVNQYAEGYLVATAEGGTGNGMYYKIKEHPVAAGVAVTLTLYQPLTVAFSTATQIDLIKSPYDGVIQNPVTTATGAPVGVAFIATTTNSYGWIQVAGVGVVKADASGAVTVGAKIIASNQTAGCVEDGDSHTQATVGVAITGIAQDEFGLADLKIG